MTKQDVYKAELKKLKEIFKDVEESKKKLVEGLIEDAAFLYAVNYDLKKILNDTGSIKVHPQHKERQKSVPAAGEFRQNLNAYSNVIKTLNAVLQKGLIDDDDDLEEFE